MKEGEGEAARIFASCRQLIDYLERRGWRTITQIADTLEQCLRQGGTVFACGNGGSASQAAHFAGELLGRFGKDKLAFPVYALTENSAVITALSNDYAFSEVYAHQLEGMGKKGDCLIALSTSGESENILQACRIAKRRGMKVIALTGRGGGRLAPISDIALSVPETNTARIQEAHLVSLHAVCQLIGRRLSAKRQEAAATVEMEDRP